VLVSAGVCFAIAALVWLGYVATSEWMRNTELLLERRKAEALALTAAALSQDMKGAWTTVLAPMNPKTLEDDPPYDVLQTAATSFARFPYPESFIVWKRTARKDGSLQDVTLALHRSDRLPAWDHDLQRADPYPVVLSRDPTALAAVAGQLAAVSADRPFVSLNATIDGHPYQVVAHLFFSSGPAQRAESAIAFTVNVEWVRQQYFGPLLHQVARIGGNEAALSVTVVDDTGQVVATSGPRAANGTTLQRSFPLLFMEPAVLTAETGQLMRRQAWSLQANPAPSSAAALAERATFRLFALIAVAAAVSVAALLLTVRAVQATALAASMKSDFVAAVTHDLKTPVALIRLVGDTLARGRYTSTETIQEYAGLLSQEAARLTRSIDNLLTYARYTDGGAAVRIALVPLDIGDIVEDALEEFRPMLAERGFDLAVDIPRTLPRVAADPRAMVQVVQSLVDNAIKYSGERHRLHISGQTADGSVTVTFADAGAGIPADDLEHVFERFYRGRNVREGGSGLGLAIAKRIIEHHGGRIALRSTVGVGTEVDVSLPVES
jgi:signal transduction histidine kinase